MENVVFRNDFGVIKDNTLVILSSKKELLFNLEEITKMTIKSNRLLLKNLVLFLIALVFGGFYFLLRLSFLWDLSFGIFVVLMVCFAIFYKECSHLLVIKIHEDTFVMDLGNDMVDDAKQIVYVWRKERKEKVARQKVIHGCL